MFSWLIRESDDEEEGKGDPEEVDFEFDLRDEVSFFEMSVVCRCLKSREKMQWCEGGKLNWNEQRWKQNTQSSWLQACHKSPHTASISHA